MTRVQRTEDLGPSRSVRTAREQGVPGHQGGQLGSWMSRPIGAGQLGRWCPVRLVRAARELRVPSDQCGQLGSWVSRGELCQYWHVLSVPVLDTVRVRDTQARAA